MELLRTARTLVFGGALLGAAACGDDNPTAPTVAEVAGRYRATTLNVTIMTVVQDVLRDGGSLTFELAENGALTGHLRVPNEGVDEDFAGTWRLEGNEVDIEDIPEVDTFVEDLEFDVRGNTLRADRIIDGVRVQVVMTKQ
jgi:hypothetical protein